MSKQKDLYGILILPWLVMANEVTLGDVRFISLKDKSKKIRQEFKEHEESFIRILSGYVNLAGNPLTNCTIACVNDREPMWNVSEADWDILARATRLLTLAGFSANEYFSQLGNYTNSSIFQSYYQQFSEPVEYVTLNIARRDGKHVIYGNVPGKTLKFSIPTQCERTRPVSVDTGLVGALNGIINDNSKLSRRLQGALEFYSLANTDSSVLGVQAEIILMASAFEQLVGAKPNAPDLSRKLHEILYPYGSVKVRRAMKYRPGIHLNPKQAAEQKEWFLHRKWLEELYVLRGSSVHGNDITKRKWDWTPPEHLLMGAFAFPLVVKLLLKKADLYNLTEKDKALCRSIDMLLVRSRWGGTHKEVYGNPPTQWESVIEKNERHYSRIRAIEIANKVMEKFSRIKTP